MTSFLRKLVCTVSGIQIEYLKMVIDIKKTVIGNPNTAEIKVYNLKKEHRKQIKDEFSDITIIGGYERGDFGILHQGTVRSVINKREGNTDIVTHIISGDGDSNHRFGKVNKTYEAEQTRPKDLILDFQKQMPGVQLGEIKGVDDFPPLDRPLTVIGSTATEMDKLARQYDLYWSVQNGFLEVIPKDGFLEETTLVTKDTGMVGTPEATELGVKVKALLDHRIRPNRLIKVVSVEENTSGVFRVDQVAYQGSNIDGEFVCNIEASRVDSSGVRRAKYKKDI